LAPPKKILFLNESARREHQGIIIIGLTNFEVRPKRQWDVNPNFPDQTET
jgi:hypothetical protein